jgi:hypothetical protein
VNHDADSQLLATLYSDEPLACLSDELRRVLPRDKDDLASLEGLAQLGYPAIEPILPHLMTWLQDINWPIAGPMAEYLATIGRPLLDVIHQVLRGDDDIWKYWVLEYLVSEMDYSLQQALRGDLERLAAGSDPEEVHVVAGDILARLQQNETKPSGA